MKCEEFFWVAEQQLALKEELCYALFVGLNIGGYKEIL
jgi:hypothetical protein